ncbi:MAG: hypothetical protein L0H41_07095 [Microlunatus sp.]|nr:hypothetical protein [Microlunatus sp.]MDN5769761.1 hypothetical protein [Microlunatus sp.]
MNVKSEELQSSPSQVAPNAPVNPPNSRAAITPFAGVGLAAVVAGGMIAAAVAHAPTEPLVWLVAYLVLIVGVAQAALGVGQHRLADRRLSPAWLWAEFALYNLGNAGVIVGTLLDLTLLVDVGGVLLVVALIGFLLGSRGAGKGALRWLYRILIVLLLISVPVGLVLAQLQAG